jgi:hypothetical protein
MQENQIVHAAFVDALSGEFIARTGCGVYVYLNPADIHSMFNEYQRNTAPIRQYVRQVVKSFACGQLR